MQSSFAFILDGVNFIYNPCLKALPALHSLVLDTLGGTTVHATNFPVFRSSLKNQRALAEFARCYGGNLFTTFQVKKWHLSVSYVILNVRIGYMLVGK